MTARSVVLGSCFGLGILFGQRLDFYVSPRSVSLTARIGQPVTSTAQVGVAAGIYTDSGPTLVPVKFKYTGVTLANPNRPMPPNYVVITPASGMTPADKPAGSGFAMRVGLNEHMLRQMQPGTYQLRANFETVDQSPTLSGGVYIDLHLSPPAQPVVDAVVNAASHLSSLSPGALVSISGSNFGPPVEHVPYDDTGTYPTALDDGQPYLGYTTVRFNGIAAPLLSVTSHEILTMVPYGVAGQGAADVVVTSYLQSSDPSSVPLLDTSPALYTANETGAGTGYVLHIPVLQSSAPIIDPSHFARNSADNPAEKGTEVAFFATGFGGYDPPVPDGVLNLVTMQPTCVATLGGLQPECQRLAADPFTLTIGGKPATIYYAGPAPYQPYSRIQILAKIPEDTDSGEQPIVLTAGQNDSSHQWVTMFIK